MKKVFLMALIGLFYFSGALLADKTGVGAERNQDRTGSPVATSSTQQCNNCHSGGNFNAAINIQLKDVDGNVVTEYNGGETYTYEVLITGSSARYGFQSVALLNSNANAGNLAINSSNARITNIGTRKYAEHNNPSTTGLFVMNWTAPATGSGTVKFYASGNCVNNNNTASGDQPVLSAPLTITESVFSGVGELSSDQLISVFPNPAEHILTINIPENKIVEVQMVDVTGKVVYQESSLENQNTIDISHLEKGIFFISFSGDITATKKFIKK